MMVITNNLTAVNAYNKLDANVAGLTKSSEKLASGFRINRAGDDAAGLAISEKMRSQLRGIKQSVRNAQDGISYIQTAEGALDSMHDILRRCKEIAAESANGTYDNSTDRAALQLEFDQLRNEIDHISLTDFNGINVFDTTGAVAPDAFGNSAEINTLTRTDTPSSLSSETVVNVTLEDGSNISFTVCFDGVMDVEAVSSAKINDYADWANKLAFGGQKVTDSAIKNFADAIKNNYLPKLTANIVSALPNFSKQPTVSGMKIGFMLYDDAASNTLAYVRSNGTTYQLAINTGHLSVDNNGEINFSDDLAGTVTHEMMHALMFDTVTNGMISINPATGKQDQNDTKVIFPHWFKEGLAETVGGGMDRLYDIMGKNNVDISVLTANNLGSGVNKDVSISDIQSWMSAMKSYNSTTNSLVGYSRGYAACMYLGYKAGGGKDLATDVNPNVIKKGIDNILVDLASGHSLDKVIAHYTGCANTSDFVNKINSTEVAQFVDKLIRSANITLDYKPAGGNYYNIIVPAAGSIVSPNGFAGTTGSFLNGAGKSYYFTLDVNVDDFDNSGNFGGKDWKYIHEGGTTTVDGTDRNGKAPTDFAGDKGGTTTDPTDPTDPTKPGGNDPTKPGGNDPTKPGGNDPTKPGGNDPTNPGGNNPVRPGKPAPESGSPKHLVLQLGSRTNNSVEFTFAYKSDGIGNLNSDLCCTAQGLGLNSLSLADQKSANAAIDGVDFAINKVSCIRATFGSVQNRLEHKITNLTNTHENITEAESQIRDTDMALEMMNYTKYQVLQSAAQTMLSQANQNPQNVLSLLG